MTVGRFLGGIGALIWSSDVDKYLLLKRSPEKDFAGGIWECVTGRVDQGEGFEEALHREVSEELGVTVQLEFVLGTTHFHRGTPQPENELIGVVCCCSISDPSAIRLSPEHSEHCWVTATEAEALLTDAGPGGAWIRRVIERAEALKPLLSSGVRAHYRRHGMELG